MRIVAQHMKIVKVESMMATLLACVFVMLGDTLRDIGAQADATVLVDNISRLILPEGPDPQGTTFRIHAHVF